MLAAGESPSRLNWSSGKHSHYTKNRSTAQGLGFRGHAGQGDPTKPRGLSIQICEQIYTYIYIHIDMGINGNANGM